MGFGPGPGFDSPIGGQGRGPGEMRAANLARAAEKLIERMDSSGIEKALLVVVPSFKLSGEEDYRSIRDAAQNHPGRLYLMAGGATLGPMIRETDPNRLTPEVLRRFDRRAEEVIREGAKGFGEMISYHLCMTEGHSFQFAPADHPLFLRLADIAARRDVPIDIHMEAVEKRIKTPQNLLRACGDNPAAIEPTVPALERLLAHNRDARIVWQHIGWDNVGQMRVPLLRRLLKAHPNLYMALRVEARLNQVGGGPPMPNRIVDADMRIRPEWRAFMEEFGDRLMIGADEFISPNENPRKPARSFSETWSMLKQLPGKLARKIGRENAARVYKMD
ncbi:amidohydrolase family protein [Nitrospinota bacterium]